MKEDKPDIEGLRTIVFNVLQDKQVTGLVAIAVNKQVPDQSGRTVFRNYLELNGGHGLVGTVELYPPIVSSVESCDVLVYSDSDHVHDLMTAVCNSIKEETQYQVRYDEAED